MEGDYGARHSSDLPIDTVTVSSNDSPMNVDDTHLRKDASAETTHTTPFIFPLKNINFLKNTTTQDSINLLCNEKLKEAQKKAQIAVAFDSSHFIEEAIFRYSEVLEALHIILDQTISSHDRLSIQHLYNLYRNRLEGLKNTHNTCTTVEPSVFHPKPITIRRSGSHTSEQDQFYNAHANSDTNPNPNETDRAIIGGNQRKHFQSHTISPKASNSLTPSPAAYRKYKLSREDLTVRSKDENTFDSYIAASTIGVPFLEFPLIEELSQKSENVELENSLETRSLHRSPGISVSYRCKDQSNFSPKLPSLSKLSISQQSNDSKVLVGEDRKASKEDCHLHMHRSVYETIPDKFLEQNKDSNTSANNLIYLSASTRVIQFIFDCLHLSSNEAAPKQVYLSSKLSVSSKIWQTHRVKIPNVNMKVNVCQQINKSISRLLLCDSSDIILTLKGLDKFHKTMDKLCKAVVKQGIRVQARDEPTTMIMENIRHDGLNPNQSGKRSIAPPTANTLKSKGFYMRNRAQTILKNSIYMFTHEKNTIDTYRQNLQQLVANYNQLYSYLQIVAHLPGIPRQQLEMQTHLQDIGRFFFYEILPIFVADIQALIILYTDTISESLVPEVIIFERRVAYKPIK